METVPPGLRAEHPPAFLEQVGHLERLAEAGGEGLVVVDREGGCVVVNHLALALCEGASEAPATLSAYLERVREQCQLLDDAWPTLTEPAHLESLASIHRTLHLIFPEDPSGVWEHSRHYALTVYPLTSPSDPSATANTWGYALFLRNVTAFARDESLETTLLSSISHDLHTPLTIMKTAVTGLLQEGVVWDDQARREQLQAINEETDRLTKLVRALLDISRIEGGALRLQREWCDLAEIVYTALDQMEKVAQAHRISTELMMPLPLVQGDQVQLGRVFTNLLENAIKYAPAGTEIRVQVEQQEGEVQVSVLDEGIGVPAEERERIFQKFYRIKHWHSSASRQAAKAQGALEEMANPAPFLEVGGSGLGLAICRGIVQQHGGRIWVEPRPAGGSCFRFTLPVEAAAPLSGGVANESSGLEQWLKERALLEG
jgi:signal transduction histidine kinase